MQICKYKLENNIHIVYPVCNFQRASDNELHGKNMHWFTINKYKTFSMLIYSYINTNGNWENEKLCGNTTPEGRSVFAQFRVCPISTSVDITIYQYEKI